MISQPPHPSAVPRRRRRGVATLAGVVVAAAAAAGLVAVAPLASATATCEVAYDVVNDWPGGFQAEVTVTNNGPALTSWELDFDLPAGQTVANGWNGQFSQSGPTVTVANEPWNGSVPTGGTVVPSFVADGPASAGVPAAFTLDGASCDVAGSPTPTPTTTAPTTTPSPTTTAPTTTPSTTTPSPTTTAPSTTAPSTTPQPGDRVDNPFVGARGYVNPAWQAEVEAQADATGGELGDRMRAVGQYPTAVWMDRIGAIDPPEAMGLRDHLDAAVVQAAGEPLTITVVIYNLPNRDCAALSSNGELRISENGLERYQTEYIDEIVSIMSDPAYADLRIVNVIEPDSLPNLVTNLSSPDCAEAQSTGAYAEGVAYALGQLRTLPNTYAYVDLGHSGWLGWDSNFQPAVDLIADAIRLPAAGVDTVDGFVSNTSGYTPTEEVFLPDPDLRLTTGGLPVRSGRFYEWNPYFDETDYLLDMRDAFVAAGLPSDIGMLVDTSRNGWGGPDRPTGPSTSTDVDTYVVESSVDARPHRGGWCNQAGAGIGERPTTEPVPGIDAYVWVKPPGESDGISEDGVPDPDDPAKGFDAMCDPQAQSVYDSQFPTNALPGAPHAGRWFAEQFEMLVTNAFPPIQP